MIINGGWGNDYISKSRRGGKESTMMENRISKMYREMSEDLRSLSQKWFGDFQEEMQGLVNALLKDSLDPRKLMHFIRSMGIDMSRLLPGMVGQQPGFDPYQILGLDKSATDEEVKKRYRELVKRLHPDTAGFEGTSFLLQMVLAAYNIIERERGWK